MENFLSIGEVSKLLDIPEPTLRYWQEKGIFSVTTDKNNYRRYTVADLINIAEIAFYRNIGMPVKQMEHFNQFNLADYDKTLEAVKDALEEKLRLYTSMYESAQLKQKHIKNIEYLKTVSYIYDQVPFERIVRFSYHDREKLIRYTKNPSLYVRYMDTHNLDNDIRGMISDEMSDDCGVLWKKHTHKQYAAFLIEEIPSEHYKNNIPEKLALIHESHQTGILLANYLLSETVKGKRIDYLKGYAEILE